MLPGGGRGRGTGPGAVRGGGSTEGPLYTSLQAPNGDNWERRGDNGICVSNAMERCLDGGALDGTINTGSGWKGGSSEGRDKNGAKVHDGGSRAEVGFIDALHVGIVSSMLPGNCNDLRAVRNGGAQTKQSVAVHPGWSGKGKDCPQESLGFQQKGEQVAHSNLFVGNLPGDISNEVLAEAFRLHGAVVSSRIFTQNGRTCALVKMATVQEAERAVQLMSKTGGNPSLCWVVKFARSDAGGAANSRGRDGEAVLAYGGKGSFAGKAVSGGKGWDIDASCVGNAGDSQDELAHNAGLGKGRGRERRSLQSEEAAPSDNLYVKGLPPAMTEAQLQLNFTKAGRVVELKLLRYSDSPEQAALVRMESAEAARAAIDALSGTVPDGCLPTLTVAYHGRNPNVASDNLYVKGLPSDFTQERVQALFGQRGAVRRCRLLPPPAAGPAPMGAAALVQMSSLEEAAQAIQHFNGRTPVGVAPRMSVRFAEPKACRENDREPSTNLYVKGLPLGTPDFLLRAVFSQYGTVVRLRVLEPKGGEAVDCVALVQMASTGEAQAAVAALHGHTLSAPLPPMRIRFAGKEQQRSANLYVAALPIDISEQQLRATFGRAGTIVRLRLLQQAGRPETHALVEMGSLEEAEAAIQRLHGQPPESLGPMLVVRFAKQRQRGGAATAGDEAAQEEAAGESEQPPESPEPPA